MSAPRSVPQDDAAGRASSLVARVVLALALIVASLGMSPGFGGEFRRSWLGHNGARYTHVARNHLRWGWVEGGAPLLLTESEAFGAQATYLHHPPGLGWLMANVFRVTGVHEDVARGIAALATLLSLVLLASLVRSVTDVRTGAFAALLAALFPMTWVYGTHVEVQGPIVLALSLGVLLVGRRALAGERSLWPTLLLTLLAGWVDWYGLYAPVLLGLSVWSRGGATRRRGLLLAGWACLVFASVAAWLATRPGAEGFERLLTAVSSRGPGEVLSPREAAGGDSVDWGQRVGSWARQVHALLPGFPIWLAGLALWCWRAPRCPRRVVWMLLVLPPVLHAAVFPAGMLEHAYWVFGLAPALGAGLVMALGAHWRVLMGLAAALALAGIFLRPQAQLTEDVLPARVGQALARELPPGSWVLTNYDTNVLIPGASGDRFVMMRPEVTFYADTPVRGGVESAAALRDARQRLPQASWFLLTPWPRAPDPQLRAALDRASESAPRKLSSSPEVWLYALER
ncbi:MAG: hypothetical protein DHS20C15_24780 [Planctomycetota bacterium]|nr:MAG: hypothetical protein DHS20C15_24780 [Planctomycetota bacterium]